MAADWQKTTEYRSKSANGCARREELIERTARSQKQLIRADQLRRLGLSTNGVQYRTTSRRLHRLHAGVYATHPPPYSRHQLYLAAVYACGPGALLTGIPSAYAYGLVETAPLIAEVTNQTGRGRSRRGITVHRRTIDRRDVGSHRGIPTTSVARTIIDCAHQLGAEATEDLIMAADSIHVLTAAASKSSRTSTEDALASGTSSRSSPRAHASSEARTSVGSSASAASTASRSPSPTTASTSPTAASMPTSSGRT